MERIKCNQSIERDSSVETWRGFGRVRLLQSRNRQNIFRIIIGAAPPDGAIDCASPKKSSHRRNDCDSDKSRKSLCFGMTGER
jgi:hypothetical protein